MRKIFYTTSFAVMGIFALAGTALATDSVSEAQCHLSASGDEIVIDYSGNRIFAPYSPQGFSVSSGVDIAAGTYDVYLEAYDGHEGRAAEEQEDEQYKVIFVSDGKTIATSNASKDVPDDKDDAFWSGKVEDTLTLSEDIDTLRIKHAHAGKKGPTNSVSPTCMKLVPQKDEPKKPIGVVCGNGKVEALEQCDDGNSVSGDGCSASCTLERNIIDPVCGNGIAEAGEQCDDGNTDENSCTRQCRFPEEDESDDSKKCDAEIGNTVWNDRNANGVRDEGEEGITDVKVKLQYGDKVKTDRTNFRGRYKFEDLCEDTYRVIVASETLDPTCYPTYDRDGTLDHKSKHKLDDDEEYTKADFGYHCPGKSATGRTSPETGAGPLAGGAAAASAAAVAWLANRRMKDESDTIIPLS